MSELVPPATGIVATAGTQPDAWSPLKALAQSILQEAEAELDLKTTRDKGVEYLYAVIAALPIPIPIKLFLESTKPLIAHLAEIGAK